MSVLNRKLRRDLFAARGMLAAIIAIIALGTACFVAMTSALLNLELSQESYYAQCRMADFSVELKKLPLAEIERLNDIRGITELRPRITFPVSVDLEGVLKPISGRVISLPAEPTPVINNVILRRGGYFTDRRPDEVIVNDAFAQAHDISPGDRLHVILNNRRQELFVVGTAISSEFVYLLGPGGLVPDPESYGIFYVKHRFAEEVFDFQGACNQILGLLSPQYRARPEAILRQLETRLEPFGVADATPRSRQPSHMFLANEIEGLRVTAVVLPTIFLSVAALILNVLMTRIAEQQRTIVGTLKALGYRDLWLFAHYLKFGTTIGLAGGLLGVAMGYALAGGMTELYKQYFHFPNLINRPYPSSLAAGVGISLLFSVLGTLRGVRSVIRLAPAESMRPQPPVGGRRIVLERWSWLWKRFDFRWHLILRGFVRHRMRTIAGIFSAAVGAALILVTLQMRDAMNEMVSFQFDKILLSDIELTFEQERDISALFESRRLPGVDYVEPVLNVGCTFHHGHRRKHGAITGLLPSARLTVPRDAAGRKVPLPDVGVLLSRRLARELDASPGDVIEMKPVKGHREPVMIPVTDVVDTYLGLAAYANFDYLNRLMGEEQSLNLLQMKVNPNPQVAQQFYRELKRMPAVQSVNSIRNNKEKIVEVLVEQMYVSIFMVIAFAGMIYFGSILNSSLISLSEREREIGLFRVLGYSPREVGTLFLRENLCLNVLGSVLGLPLGYWLSVQTSKMMDTELFRIPLVILPMTWFVPVLLGICFSVLAHVPVQRAINRMDWLQALNVKE